MKWVVLDCRTREIIGQVEAMDEEKALLLGRHYENQTTKVLVVSRKQFEARNAVDQPAAVPNVPDAVRFLHRLHAATVGMEVDMPYVANELACILELLGEKPNG